MHFDAQHGAFLAADVGERFDGLAHFGEIFDVEGTYEAVSLASDYVCLRVVEGHRRDLLLRDLRLLNHTVDILGIL